MLVSFGGPAEPGVIGDIDQEIRALVDKSAGELREDILKANQYAEAIRNF